MKTMLSILILFLPMFSTAADDFTFAVIGDTRPPIGKARNDYTNFIRQLDEIKARRPRLVINVGDLIEGYSRKPGEDDWAAYKAIMAKYDFTYFQIPGNHDVSSLKAEDIYKKEFGPLYYSFDEGGVHFVMLDNSEKSIWGYIGEGQAAWLKSDLEANRGKRIFVFLHVAPWHKVLVDKKYTLFWKNRLHPLFTANKVTAVFAGHVHQYGPTYEFDGIKYFITAGGGAELMRGYKNYGGDFHFMTVTLSGGGVDYRVVMRGAVLTDAEADVQKNHIFAAGNSNNLAVDYDALLADKSLPVELTLTNPYNDTLSADLVWTYDKKVFKIVPEKITRSIRPFSTRHFAFRIDLLDGSPGMYDFPSIACSVRAGDKTNYFEKELAITRTLAVKKHAPRPTFSGNVSDWRKFARIELSTEKDPARSGIVYINYDSQYFYAAARVKNQALNNLFDDNMIFLNDSFIVGFDPDLGNSADDRDDIQLEFSRLKDKIVVYDRVNGEALDASQKGIVCRITKDDGGAMYEIAIPVSLLNTIKLEKGARFGFNCALVYSVQSGGERVVEWQPGIGGGLGIDDKFRSHHHFGIIRLE